MRRHHLGVVFLHGCGGDDGVCPFDVRGVVADEDLGTEGHKTARDGALAQVAAGNAEALVEQHLGDAVHAGAADANEMNMTNGVFHF